VITVFLGLLNALVHKTHHLSSPKNLGKILVPIYRTLEDSVKHSRQKSSFKRQNTAYHRYKRKSSTWLGWPTST